MNLDKSILVKLSFVVFTVLFQSNLAFAQISTQQLGGSQINTITKAVPFLLISPDSRSGAMGDVGVATNPDHNSIHWNASKFAFMLCIPTLLGAVVFLVIDMQNSDIQFDFL